MTPEAKEAAKKLIAELVQILSDMPDPNIEKYSIEASTGTRIGTEQISIDLGSYRSIGIYFHRGFKE